MRELLISSSHSELRSNAKSKINTRNVGLVIFVVVELGWSLKLMQKTFQILFQAFGPEVVIESGVRGLSVVQ